MFESNIVTDSLIKLLHGIEVHSALGHRVFAHFSRPLVYEAAGKLVEILKDLVELPITESFNVFRTYGLTLCTKKDIRVILVGL